MNCGSWGLGGVVGCFGGWVGEAFVFWVVFLSKLLPNNSNPTTLLLHLIKMFLKTQAGYQRFIHIDRKRHTLAKHKPGTLKLNNSNQADL